MPKLDKGMIFTIVVATFAAAAIGYAIRKFVPDSVPGVAAVKEAISNV